MVVEIGNRIGTSESFAELRVLREGNHWATIHNSAFRRFRVTEAETEIPHCEANIVGCAKDLSGLLRVGTELEVWATRAGQPLALLIRAKVDFVVEDNLHGPDGETSIEFQARSVASVLMDGECKGRLSGTVKEVISAIVAPHKLESVVEGHKESVELLLGCASAYGALRLLAVSLDSVVYVSREGCVEFYSREYAFDKMCDSEPQAISDSDIKASKFSEGHPIKKR